MTLTRQHFQLLADALALSRPPEGGGGYATVAALQWRDDVRRVADALASTNPRFNRDRFYTAAGYEA